MDLAATVKVNRQILTLIESKYTELFPAAFTTLEARYYLRLEADTAHAENALTHDGLVVPPEDEGTQL